MPAAWAVEDLICSFVQLPSALFHTLYAAGASRAPTGAARSKSRALGQFQCYRPMYMITDICCYSMGVDCIASSLLCPPAGRGAALPGLLPA